MNWVTTWKGLGHPRPLPEPTIYREHVWTVRDNQPLTIPDSASPRLDVVWERQTIRQFGKVADRDIASLLWAVAACKQSIDSPMGFPLERRGAPSAGAIHPIHILVCAWPERTLARYDGLSHAMQPLGITAPDALLRSIEAMVDPQEGTLLLFVAEPGKTASKYADPIPLVLRDAGVLQGTMAVAAEALGLNFCILGATGDPWMAALSQEGKLCGVGAALVGART